MKSASPLKVLKVVGVVSVILAALGYWYNLSKFFVDYSSILHGQNNEIDRPHFYEAFYSMSAICIAFNSILLVTGIQLIREKIGWAIVLLITMALEVIYYFLIGAIWASGSPYGNSVAAATGISNGGLAFQAAVLFPIWGPWAALWARGKIMSQSKIR